MAKRQKTVVVIYFGDDWDKKGDLFSNVDTQKSFECWNEESLKQGIAMYRASIAWYDQKKHFFTKAWCFRDGIWKRVRGPIIPDMIVDKLASKKNYALHDIKMAMAEKVKMFNQPEFSMLLDNKLSQYVLLKEFMPKSFSAASKKELAYGLSHIKTELAVVKPLNGSSGKGIVIGKKGSLAKKQFPYPVLVQEFIDGSGGVPGTDQNSLADLRIVYVNHKPIYALMRSAKKHSLLTNFDQGATAHTLKLSQVPKSALAKAKEICKTMSVFPECQYSLDFIFKKHTPFLIEVNTKPGIGVMYAINNMKTQKKYFDSILSLVP